MVAKDQASEFDTITGANIAATDRFFVLDVSDTTSTEESAAGGTVKAIVESELPNIPSIAAALDAAGVYTTDAEIMSAYHAQVGFASQSAAEAGTGTGTLRWSPERVKQAIDALAGAAGTTLNTRIAALEAGGTEGKTLTTGSNAGSITPATMFTYTIPANTLAVGDTAMFWQMGDGLVNDAGLMSPVLYGRHNTSTFVDSIGTSITEAASASRWVWTLLMTVVVRTSTVADITVEFHRSGNAAAAKFRSFSAGKSMMFATPPSTGRTINLTVANTFDVQAAWSAASATCDITWGPSYFSLIKGA